MNVSELANLINDFLNDDDKAELFTTNHFKNAKPYLKKMIINSITDEKLKMELFLDFDVISNFSDYEIRDFMESLNDDLKIKLIKDSNFLNQHNIKSYEIKEIILNLDQESKYKLLSDSDYLQNELKLESYNIAKIISRIDDEEKINKQFELIEKYCPEFATCQNSTMSILEGNIFDSDNIDFNRCIINRVYEKNDENKEAVLYVYLDLPDVGKKFYFADKKEGHFVELPKKEFEEKFECYEADMEKLNGHREWEDIEVIKKPEDLTKSSGKVVAMEGEAR